MYMYLTEFSINDRCESKIKIMNDQFLEKILLPFSIQTWNVSKNVTLFKIESARGIKSSPTINCR